MINKFTLTLFDLSNDSSCTIPKMLDVPIHSLYPLFIQIQLEYRELMNELQVLQVQFNLTLPGHHHQTE